MFEKNFYCVSSRVENSGQLYGCFKIGPFFGHQSLTFANALRRTLLADRNRCTFDAIQIYGVEHEFSSLIGVRESVIDILLNLEKLNFQITRPITKPQVAFLNFCGPGILRAQHLHLPSSLKCIVPDQYIATLEINGRLTVKLFFSPNWDKFQYNIQNSLWNQNSYYQTENKIQHPRGSIDRKNKKTNLKYFLKHRPILQKKVRQPMHELPSNQIHRTFNNRLKIIHYLTNTLFSSHQDHLQLLFVQFQFWPHIQSLRESNVLGWRAMCIFDQQFPLYEKLKNYRTQKESNVQACKYFLIKSKKKQIEKNKYLCFKTRSKIKKRKIPIFTQKIRENFLFLKSSFCTIEKVNYTLQSFDFQSDLTLTQKTIQNTTLAPLLTNGHALHDAQPNQTQKVQKSHFSIAPLNLNCTLKLKPPKALSPVQGWNSSDKSLNLREPRTSRPSSFYPQSEGTGSKITNHSLTTKQRHRGFNRTPPDTPSKIKLLTSQKKEFILFEVWTDGSLHPQTAILNAINELLFEIFAYSLQVFKYEKVHPITSNKSRSLKRREVTDLSRKHFREKFLNLEIGNFHFDLETYLFLKKIKVYRIIDFLNFFSKKRDQKPKITEKNFAHLDLDLFKVLQSTEHPISPVDSHRGTAEQRSNNKIKMTLYQFQIFIHSVLTIDPVIQSSS